MLAHISPEEFTTALDAVVADLLTLGGVDDPPVDTFAVAERLGIAVAWDDQQLGRARIVRLASTNTLGTAVVAGPARPSILLKHEPRAEREQWSVAHELGEHQAEALFRRLGVSPVEAAAATREQCANLIANRLLLPTTWFVAHGELVDWDLRQLKQQFVTASHELIARRLLDLGPASVMAVVDNGRLTWRRGNLGGRMPVWSALEKRAWETAHHTGTDVEQCAGPWRVRVWPIHEADWKREIVRLEYCASYEPEEWETV